MDFQPVTKNGSQPPSGYVVFVGNNDINVLFSEIPTFSYSKLISNTKRTSYLFTRPGRQDDFNYWFNTRTPNNNTITAHFRMRFDEPFVENGPYYVVMISFDLRFDKPVIISESKKEEQYSKVRPIGGQPQEELVDKDEEELNKAFDELPSEDEN